MIFITARKKKAEDKVDVDPMSKLAWFVSAIEDSQHWNYNEGDSVLVMAYTTCPEAELFLNGKSFGQKRSNPANSSIWWYIPYHEGEVKVVAKSPDGQQLLSSLKTVSQPAHISISADAKTIRADGQDAACQDNMKLSLRKAFQERCIAVIQSNGNKGKIRINAKVYGIPGASIEIIAE